MTDKPTDQSKTWLRGAVLALKAAIPVVVRFVPQLAIWSGFLYAVVDIILRLI
jgi:hypothetical protein